jgi:hypothetical protein
LKVGDEVAATYSESLAVSIRKAGEPAPAKEKETITAQKPKSGTTGTAQQTITVTVSVEEIDKPTQTLKVKGPEGRVVRFRVHDQKSLQSFEVGDTVDLSLKQAQLLKIDLVGRRPVESRIQ